MNLLQLQPFVKYALYVEISMKLTMYLHLHKLIRSDTENYPKHYCQLLDFYQCDMDTSDYDFFES